ncbi:MAG: CsbD family protein [Thainema sp.]
MAIEDRVEATAKNIEGKAQEAVGEMTGDPQDKAEGKAKQVEAAAQQQKENIKDNMKESIDNV